MTAKHVFISGKVQGVYFRDSTREKAIELGLTGWVRNLPDGRVEALFCGGEENLRKMLEWCWHGSPRSRVENVAVADTRKECRYEEFFITR